MKVYIFNKDTQKTVTAELSEKSTNHLSEMQVVIVTLIVNQVDVGRMYYHIDKDHLYIHKIENYNKFKYAMVGTVLTQYAFTQSLNFGKEGNIRLDSVNGSAVFWNKMGFTLENESSKSHLMFLPQSSIDQHLNNGFVLSDALEKRTILTKPINHTSTTTAKVQTILRVKQETQKFSKDTDFELKKFSDSDSSSSEEECFDKQPYNKLNKEKMTSKSNHFTLEEVKKMAESDGFKWKTF